MAGPPVRRPREGREGEHGPARPHPTAGDRGDPPRLPARGRRRGRDRHVHGDADRPGRLRPRGRGARAERGGRTHRPSGGRPRDGGGPLAAPLRGGLHRAHEPHGVHVPEGRGPRLPRGDVRRARRRLPRAGGGSPRGRGRSPAAGDVVRHAQPEGLPRRDRGGPRGRPRGRPPPRVDLGHDHGCLGPHPLGADRRGVLELGGPRAAPGRGDQLRPRRAGDGAARRGARADRGHGDPVLPQRRAAERVRRLRRPNGSPPTSGASQPEAG